MCEGTWLQDIHVWGMYGKEWVMLCVYNLIVINVIKTEDVNVMIYHTKESGSFFVDKSGLY